MAGISKEERLARIHKEAITEFDRVQSALREERLNCLTDRRFYSISGAQWEGPLGDLFENKPRFEFNKVHLSVIRVINEYRNNRITVDFVPKDGQPDDLADTCDGLYRADEHDSGAQEAYDNAFEEGVGGGFGAWRLRAVYEDEEDEEATEQRISIEPIYDADSSVYFNLDAKRQDKADAKRCWVLTSMTYEAFEEEFGHSPTTWPKTVTQRVFDWWTPNVVYVAEYYVVEETTKTLHVFRGLDDSEQTLEDEDMQDQQRLDVLRATGFREVRQKKVKRRQVHKYLMSGNKIERDEGIIAGRHIPIVPFYAKRWFVDNVERCMGHVRLAKDAQRLTNSLLSWMTELAASFGREKPIFSPEQMMGHADLWARDNIDNLPYLLANQLRDAEGNPIPGSAAPVAYTKAPSVPPAMAALVQMAYQALDDLMGNQQAGEQVQPNISGKLMEMVQQRLDMQTYIYMDNFAKAMRRSGEVWLSMKRDITVEDERRMRTIGKGGEVDSVVIRQPWVDEETGEEFLKNNLEDASFDVWVDVGPSSTSQRQATVRSLTGLAKMTADTQLTRMLITAAVMNLEGEGLEELRDYSRRQLIQMGVVKPTEEEAQELAQEAANTPPDPQAQALLAMAEESQANAALGRAKTVQTVADADLKRAQTAKVEAETLGSAHDRIVSSAESMHRMLMDRQAQQTPSASGA